jgi:hypothetical protein
MRTFTPENEQVADGKPAKYVRPEKKQGSTAWPPRAGPLPPRRSNTAAAGCQTTKR